jgi:hypothetical protein
MIGYFLKSDRSGLAKIHPVLWGQDGIATLAKASLKEKSFGQDISLVLIQVVVESDLLLDFDPIMAVGRYSKRDKSINVRVPITKKTLELSHFELRDLLVRLTCNAVDLVAAKFRGKVDVDFSALKMEFLQAVT